MVSSKFQEVLDDQPASPHNISLEDILADNRARAASHGSSSSDTTSSAAAASAQPVTAPPRSESTRQKLRRLTRGEKSR